MLSSIFPKTAQMPAANLEGRFLAVVHTGRSDGGHFVIEQTVVLVCADPENSHVLFDEVMDTVEGAAGGLAKDVDGITILTDGETVVTIALGITGIADVGEPFDIILEHGCKCRVALGRCNNDSDTACDGSRNLRLCRQDRRGDRFAFATGECQVVDPDGAGGTDQLKDGVGVIDIIAGVGIKVERVLCPVSTDADLVIQRCTNCQSEIVGIVIADLCIDFCGSVGLGVELELITIGAQIEFFQKGGFCAADELKGRYML